MAGLPGPISPETSFFDLNEPLALECGQSLPSARVAYRTWGRLSPEGDNAVLVCHALTGSADADDWWSGMIGEGKSLDPDRDFVVCSNILGSCYGTTGPVSTTNEDGATFGPDFPAVTVRDMVEVQARLMDHLGVRVVDMVIGGSLGGMQALEWAVMYPDRVRLVVPIAISARHSAWCIALSESQRQAIYADSSFNGGRYPPGRQPVSGLAAARMVAMCTYRSWEGFESRFGRRAQDDDPGLFQAESYLRYQGDKLVSRFDANTYVCLTKAMDTHDLSRGRGTLGDVLSGIRAPTLVVSIDSDVLYPPREQALLHDRIPGAELSVLHSRHGHDAFLIEVDELDRMVSEFRRRHVR